MRHNAPYKLSKTTKAGSAFSQFEELSAEEGRDRDGGGYPKMPKIALFLGAGASKPFGLPTVNEFFERVSWDRKGYRLATCELARRIWISRGKREACPFPSFNSEWLLEDLQKIVDIERLRETGWNIPECTAQELLAFLKREVVRVFGQERKPDPSLAYLPLIKRLNEEIGIEGPLKVFTTNYDTIIETLFRKPDSKALDVQFIEGFKKGSNNGTREWSIKEYQPSLQAGNKLRVELFKLHGSVTWKWDAEKVVDLGWAKPTDYDCLLYLGYKGIPEWEYTSSNLFWHLHEELIKALHTYDLFIVIGFSFGDAFIRNLFSIALRGNTNPRGLRVVIATPDKSGLHEEVGDAWDRRYPIDFLGCPFGEENFTEELLNMRIVKEIKPQRS